MKTVKGGRGENKKTLRGLSKEKEEGKERREKKKRTEKTCEGNYFVRVNMII